MSKTLAEIIRIIQQTQQIDQYAKEYKSEILKIIQDNQQRGINPFWQVHSKFKELSHSLPFRTFIPQRASLSSEVKDRFESYQQTPSQPRCEELISMVIIGMSQQAARSTRAKKEQIEKLITPLKKTLSKIKKPLNNKARLTKIRDLLDQVETAKLSRLVNKSNRTINADMGIQQRIDFVRTYINHCLKQREQSLLSRFADTIQPAYKAITHYFEHKNRVKHELSPTPTGNKSCLTPFI